MLQLAHVDALADAVCVLLQPRPDAEHGAAARHVVELDHAVGDHQGVVIGQRDDAGAELDVITKTSRYLLGFLVAAITLELLDLIFRGYTAMKSWDILRSVMYGKDFINIFIDFSKYTA